MAGLLGAAALATLPIMTHAADDDGEAMGSPAVSDNISEAAPPAWQQIGDNNEIAASDGPILELPQVVTSSHPQSRATDTSADDASTEDASAQGASLDDGTTKDDSVNDEDATPPPPIQQLGDVDDYKDQETVASALPLWPAPAAVVSTPRVYLGRNYGAMPRPSVIVVRPFGLSPIPATSPMLSAPFRSGSVLGGWWQRAR